MSKLSPKKTKFTFQSYLGFLTGALMLIACQSDSPPANQKTEQTSPTKSNKIALLEHLPAQTSAFLLVNLEEPKTRTALAKNVQATLATPLQDLSALAPEQRELAEISQKNFEEIKKLLESINSSGILPRQQADGSFQDGEARELLAAISWGAQAQKSPQAALLVRTATPAETALKNLKEELKKGGVKIQDEPKGFAMQRTDQVIHFAGEENKLVVSSQQTNETNKAAQTPQAEQVEIETEFASALLHRQSNPAPILTSLQSKVPDYANKPILGFADFQDLENTHPGLNVPALTYATLQVSPEQELSYTNVEAHFDMAKTPIKEQLKSLQGLSATTVTPLSERIAVEFTLSDVAINTLRSELGKLEDFQKQADLAAVLPILQALGNLKIGVTSASETSPFPELFLSSATKSNDSLAKILEDLLNQNLSAMLGGLQWQTKEIGGTNVKYLTSPFGIGLFLGSSANKVVLTTGEDSLRTVLEPAVTATQRQKLLNQKLEGIKGLLFSYYLNGEKLAKTLQDVSQTAAPFTGGQTAIDPQMFQKIKEQGEVVAALTPIDDGLALHAWSFN